MTAVRLPRLSRPDVLESISPKRLFALLHPIPIYLQIGLYQLCRPIRSIAKRLPEQNSH
jgi:hypothetical protein